MSFYTQEISTFNNMLLIPIPKDTSLELISKAQSEGKNVRVEISVPKKKRSHSANSYCWVLCQKIAEAISVKGSLFTREEIYRKNIKELFAPSYIPVKNEDVKDWLDLWCSRGIGWLAEDIGESKLNGYTRLALWKGSSQFDTQQMSRLLDGLVQEAKDLGLSVETEEQLKRMIGNWDTDRKKENER